MLIILSLLLPLPLIHLLSSGYIDLLLQCLSAPLLLLKQLECLLLGFLDLLIKDLILLIAHALEDVCLPLNELLSLSLLLSELHVLAVFLQLIQLVLLLCVQLNALLFLKLPLALSLLVGKEVCIGPPESFLLLLLLVLALPFLLGLSLELLFDLPVDEISLEPLLLYPLDVVHLELVELLADGLGVLLLAVELSYQLRLYLLIVGLHLRAVKFLPFLLEFLLVIALPLLVVLLDVSLGEDIREQELALEGLNNILVFVCLLVSALHHLHAKLLLQLKLKGVNATALDLLSF